MGKIALGGWKIVNKEEVEQLMLRYFPSCPLCGANAGYEVSGAFLESLKSG